MFVASTEFTEAARIQAEALGFEEAGVFVDHPIQDRTKEEIRALADGAFEDLLSSLRAD